MEYPSVCQDLFSLHIDELSRIKNLHEQLGELYNTKIGTLYDEFNIEIPLRFEQEDWLWSPATIETVKLASNEAATILDEARVKPKPYDPATLQEVRDRLKLIQKTMLTDTLNRLVDCACPTYREG